MKFIFYCLLGLVAQISLAAPITLSVPVNMPTLKLLNCTLPLDKASSEFLSQLQRFYSVAFSTSEGSVFDVRLQRNNFGVFTGDVTARKTPQVYSNMPVYICRENGTQNYYSMLYADQISPIGTYKYEGFILLPMNIKTSVNTLTYINLRKGVFTPATIRIDLSRRR